MGTRALFRTALRALYTLALPAIVSVPACLMAATVSVEAVGPDGAPLANAVVSLETQRTPGSGSDDATAIMDQINRQFVPYVLPVQTGTRVSFPNSDDIRHHVYSFSEPKRFELRLYHGEDAAPVRFDRAGVVVLGCNIHDGMLGYIVVLDTPLFAKTDASGIATLHGIAAGDYSARLWHPRLPNSAERPMQMVSIATGETRQIEFRIEQLKPDPRASAPDNKWERLFRDTRRQ